MEGLGIKNYYERYVMNEIDRTLRFSGKIEDEQIIPDIACLALNQLPAKYIRHHIDATFYMTPAEQEKIERIVAEAVAAAYKKVVASPVRS